MMLHSGSTPGVGRFTVRRDDRDYMIMISLADGTRVERWVTDNRRVYEVLQEYGLLHSVKISGRG